MFVYPAFGQEPKLERAEKELLNENWDELETICNEWLRKEENPIAYYLLHVVYFSKGQNDQKEKVDKKILDASSTDLMSWAYKLVDRYPKHPVALHILGGVEVFNDKYEDAISHISKAIQFRPEYVDAYFTRGNAYNQVKKYKEAIDDFTTVIKSNSKHLLEIAYFNRGNEFYRGKQYDNAIGDYGQVIKINPKHVGAYNTRGNCYYLKGKLNEAKNDWKKVVDLDPNGTMGKAAKNNLSVIK
jgi:tetratricopeptide (TPR) repeat protein